MQRKDVDMKKMLFPMLVVIALFALLSGCASTSKRSIDVGTQRISSGVVQEPVVAKLAVSPVKTTGRVEGKIISNFSDGLEELKSRAVLNAISPKNADVLVEPLFDITRRNNNFTVIVTGYPGTYTDFRAITEADAKWMKSYNAVKVYTPDNKTDTVLAGQKTTWYYWLLVPLVLFGTILPFTF